MKTIIKSLSVIIILIILSVSMLSVSAAIASIPSGDIDFDYVITIKDATLIQKYLSELESFDKLQAFSAEVDADGRVTIKDATMIQKKCAGLIDAFNVSEYVPNSIQIHGFNANFDSGKAMVGVPVTFIINASGEPKPLTYKYFINGEEVAEISEESTFTYTFEKAEKYEIMVVAKNCLDNYWYATIDNYEVVEPYESENVAVKAFYHNYTERSLNTYDTTMKFTAEGMFGSGEYEYAFYVDGVLKQDFSETSSYPVGRFEEERDYTFTVIIKDTVTGKTDTEDMTVTVREPIQ